MNTSHDATASGPVAATLRRNSRSSPILRRSSNRVARATSLRMREPEAPNSEIVRNTSPGCGMTRSASPGGTGFSRRVASGDNSTLAPTTATALSFRARRSMQSTAPGTSMSSSSRNSTHSARTASIPLFRAADGPAFSCRTSSTPRGAAGMGEPSSTTITRPTDGSLRQLDIDCSSRSGGAANVGITTSTVGAECTRRGYLSTGDRTSFIWCAYDPAE